MSIGIKNIDFPELHLSDSETEFLRAMNDVILEIPFRLPLSIQQDCSLFILKYSRSSLDGLFDFFKFYKSPIWTAVCYATQRCNNKHICILAPRAISLSLFIHSLDDHLHDGEIPCTHLMLALRSELWRWFLETLYAFSDDDGIRFEISHYIDRYYSRIGKNEYSGLDEYSKGFSDEMAIVTVVLYIVLSCSSVNKIQQNIIIEAYEKFGCAWRYLDDLQDYEKDIASGVKTYAYFLLDAAAKKIWNKVSEIKDSDNGQERKEVISCIESSLFIDDAVNGINNLLNDAANSTKKSGLTDLAQEYKNCAIVFDRINNE